MSKRKTGESISKKIARLERKIKLLEEKVEMQRSEFTARMDGHEEWIRNCPPQNSNLFKLMCEFKELKEAFIMQSNILLLLMRRTFSLMQGRRPAPMKEQAPSPP